MNDNAKHFGGAIDQLIKGQDLTREQSFDFFTQILEDRQSAIHQGAFLAAITAKGPRPAEIAGAWEAIYQLDTVKIQPRTTRLLLDNCGTGMDSFKTFNISTAAAIVAAAGGCCLARHGARAITSGCGTVDLCQALGVDVDCPVETVCESIQTTGIGLFNGMSPAVHPRALFRILTQMRFGSILNIAASLANPARPSLGVRGVYCSEMVLPVIRTMQAIGFQRALVFHGNGNGVGGMDELSVLGPSQVAELSEDGAIAQYQISPESMGLQPASSREIAAGKDVRHEAHRLLTLFSGAPINGLHDAVCLNAAPILYLGNQVATLRDGVVLARDIIASGQALAKLTAWVQAQNRNSQQGQARLQSLLDRI
jgi:anthranilate phosphoribosyltransferase